jgi:hypothetical protein
MTSPEDKTIVELLLAQFPAVELLKIVPMNEAARLSGLSQDSLQRHHPKKIVHLSPRRRGMRQGDALMLREPDTS